MQMDYVSIDNMMVDAWMPPEVVELKPPVAVATIRSRRAEGIPFVTRERTTHSKYVVPPPSSYVRYQEKSPMLPDLVLQDSVQEDLTYSEHKELAKLWHTYSSIEHPSSRPK